MNPLSLIAKHLDQANMKLKVHECQALCAFSGKPISNGVLLSDLVKVTFTDHAYVRYPSKYASVEAAMCIESVIPSTNPNKKGKVTYNSMRNYSYLATGQELRLLKREELLDTVMNLPKEPFVFAVTYSNKKHTSYKTVLNTNPRRFTLTTDVANLLIDLDEAEQYLPIMQRWYSIIPEKAHTKQQPTWFTKANIDGQTPIYSQIVGYGEDRFERENELLKQFRGTKQFQFFSFILNKT